MLTVNQRSEHIVQLRISPTPCGHFFIYDTSDRIWDGETWRSFGAAFHYNSYQDAFHVLRRDALLQHYGLESIEIELRSEV